MTSTTRKLTRRQKRLSEKALILDCQKIPSIKGLNFNLRTITPMTDNQEEVFDCWDYKDHLLLHGCAGTGKSFISLFLALRELEDKASGYNKLIIIRTPQPSKQIGFLPGDEKQKLEVYEAPYKAICSELYNRDDAYEVLKKKGVIEFTGTSFLRGITIDNAIILVDEIQNMSYQELRTVITRVGENSRVIFCGDTKQDDLTSERFKETSGLVDILKIFKQIGKLGMIEFTVNDIVRSGFVKDFIIAEHNLRLD